MRHFRINFSINQKFNRVLPMILVFLIMNTGIVYTQDIIKLLDGSKIKADIKEVSDTEVKYTLFGANSDVIIVMNAAKIREIDFQSGAEMKFEREVTDDDVYFVDDKRNILKTPFLGVLSNKYEFLYERGITHKSSFQVGLSVYVKGENIELDRGSGVSFYGGYKFKFMNEKSYRRHAMTGLYLMPSARFGIVSGEEIFSGPSPNSGRSIPFGSVDLNCGLQYVMGNVFVLDFGVFLGVGGVDSYRSYDDPYGSEDNHLLISRSDAIIDNYSFGAYVRIGLAFGDTFGASEKK